jgi:PhoH-like ATPase
MRVKCDALGILTEDYVLGKIVKNASDVFTGMTKHLVDDAIIDRFYEGEEVFLDAQDIYLMPNQFVMLVSNSTDKKTALARFYDYSKSLKRMNGDWKDGIWGVTPRNKEQQFAFEMLMDPEVEVVSLVGKAGSGKTLCALAAGIEQILKPSKSPDTSGKHTYSRLIVTRPIQPLGKDIGYLPGTMEEKMAPWLMPIQDNLQYLLGDDKATLEMYMSDGIIEVEALTYIRGRSISNAFIIVDEAQNLTKHELKTIITRVGEGTKIVFTGDIEQIDNIYVDETSNGLTYAVEKLKKYDITGHVTLTKGERSKVATLASKIL